MTTHLDGCTGLHPPAIGCLQARARAQAAAADPYRCAYSATGYHGFAVGANACGNRPCPTTLLSLLDATDCELLAAPERE